MYLYVEVYVSMDCVSRRRELLHVQQPNTREKRVEEEVEKKTTNGTLSDSVKV